MTDALLSSVLDENFLHASIFDVFVLVTDALHTSMQFYRPRLLLGR